MSRAVRKVDIAVVGAGPVGLMVAALLSRSAALEVAVLDARDAPPPPIPEGEVDARVFALNRGSQRLLETTGAWRRLVPGHAWPYSRMRIWDAALAGPPESDRLGLCFDAATVGEPDLGHIVENAAIERALREVLEGSGGCSCEPGFRLDSLDWHDDRVRLTAESGATLEARLVVGADGAGSAVRTLAGLDARPSDYGQRALVCHVTTERAHRDTAWQRFLPGGPVALLPLGDGRCSVVWSLDTAEADALQALDEHAFAARLAAATESVLGRVLEVTPRHAFPLLRLHAPRYVGRRCVLVGDAAHVVHPLAGQGVNLGLMDAAALAQVLGTAHDPGERAPLRRYERWRKSENLLVLGALHGLHHIFRLSAPPLAQLRAAALGQLDRVTPVKTLLVRRALGLGGELPRLARA